eukprot:5580056-Amphidinium_carterae.1
MAAMGPEPASASRGQASDQLVQAALQAGDPSQLGVALNLVMVEAIERLQKGRSHGGGAGDEDEFDVLLSGAQGNLEDGGIGGGAKGIQAMLRLSRAVERNPTRWSQAVDEAAWRALGCNISGQPWSMSTYASQRIRFGRLSDHQRMWSMLASLHSLHRSGDYDMLGARIGQCLKAVEASVALSGGWELAWLYTGLPDPINAGGLHRGLSSLGEVAAAAGYLRDMQVVEASLKRASSTPSGAPSPDAGQERPGKKPPKANKGKGKEAAQPPSNT